MRIVAPPVEAGVKSQRPRPRSGRASGPLLFRATGIPARGFRSRALLAFELDQELAAGDAVAGRDVERLDPAVERRVDRDLHLHRLQHDEGSPSLYLVPRLDLDADDRAGHRCRHGRAPFGGSAVATLGRQIWW